MLPVENYVRSVILPLLSNPGALQVSQSSDDMGVLLSITVAPEDMGGVIGKTGATANAIRQLVRIVGLKHDARVSLRFTEPDGSFRRKSEFQQALQAK